MVSRSCEIPNFVEEKFSALLKLISTEKDIHVDECIGFEEVLLKFEHRLQYLDSKSVNKSDIGENRTDFLIFGFPGNGKTHLVKFLASKSKIPFLLINAVELCSRFLNFRHEQIEFLFDLAVSRQPCVLFIDEIEQLLDLSENHLTQLCDQIDRLRKTEAQVLTITATSKPWKLPPIFYQRFRQKIHIDFPTLETRIHLLRKFIPNQISTTFQDKDWSCLGEKTNKFSISDLLVLSRDIAMISIRELSQAQYFKRIQTHDDSECRWTMCSDGEPGATSLNVFELDESEIFLRPIVFETDVLKILSNMKPSFSEDMVSMLMEFAENS